MATIRCHEMASRSGGQREQDQELGLAIRVDRFECRDAGVAASAADTPPIAPPEFDERAPHDTDRFRTDPLDRNGAGTAPRR